MHTGKLWGGDKAAGRAWGGGLNTFYLSYFINSLEIRMNSITLSRNLLRKAI